MASIHSDEHRETGLVDFGFGTGATSLSESVAAVAVIVLAILGLVNVAPPAMVAIATIVAGVAIFLQGARIVGEYSHLTTMSDLPAKAPENWMGGVSLEFLAGGAGIVLGILALFSGTPALAPAAVIVFGGTLLLNGSVSRLPSSAASSNGAHDATSVMVASQMRSLTAGGQILIGIAALILGILALVPIHGSVLTLVGLLAVGTSLLISGLASVDFFGSSQNSRG